MGVESDVLERLPSRLLRAESRLFLGLRGLFLGLRGLFARSSRLFLGLRGLFVRSSRLFLGLRGLFARSSRLFLGLRSCLKSLPDRAPPPNPPPLGAGLSWHLLPTGGGWEGAYSNPIEVVAWSRGFSRIEPPEGSTPFHNLDRLAIAEISDLFKQPLALPQF